MLAMSAITITPREVYELQQNGDEAEIARAQAQVGGRVYRLLPEDLPQLEKRIEKLNKKAVKIGTDPIEIKVLDTEKVVREVDGEEREFEWHWVILNGKTPVIPGYTFLATLDHTIQEDEGDPVTIARTPFQSEELAAIDLDKYRNAENVCDHCGYKRRRNHTYVLLNEAEGTTMQAGSSCLKDFTGAHNPERVAQWVEWLSGLDWDLEVGSSDSRIFRSGRTVEPIIDYLTYVACAIRRFGWEPRWKDGERNWATPTANEAWQMFNDERNPRITVPEIDKPTAEDHEIAEKALNWARSMADRDDLSEFEHNMVAVTNSNYMPRKGDGVVAYVVEGYRRAMDHKAEEEARANLPEPTPVVEGKIEITGTVIKDDMKYYDDNARHVMTVVDDRGFKVWGTVPRSIDTEVERGTRVTFTATVSKSDRDETFGFYKRPSKAQVIA